MVLTVIVDFFFNLCFYLSTALWHPLLLYI